MSLAPSTGPATEVTRRRAQGALYGLALGDALGMPTQDLTREQIRADHGTIDRLLPAGPHQLIAAGQVAGTVTDDTEQMILVAELLVRHGRIGAREFAEALVAWEERMRTRGSLDLLGPSTTAAIAALRRGASTQEAGRCGTTNGAAMRIAPVGVLCPPEPLSALVERVVEASVVTHNTSLGLAAAAAVAAAVSAGISGADREQAIEHAVRAAELGARRGHPVAGPSIAARTRWAIDFLPAQPDLDRAVYEVIGTGVAAQESVVAALAIAATVQDPWEAVCRAAGAGGDTDTVAAIVGAVVGAGAGLAGFPRGAIQIVRRVNDLQLETIVDALLVRRARTASGTEGAQP